MIKSITLQIGGMMCVRCAGAVEHALSSVEGVKAVTVSYANERAEITYDADKINLRRLEKAVKAAGYTVVEDRAVYRRRELRELTALFVISAVLSAPFMLMMVLMFAAPNSQLTHLLHNKWLQLVLATPVQFFVGRRFYKGAFLSLKNHSPNMDVLIALGTSAAYGYSLYNAVAGGGHLYFESSAMLITLVLLGKLLETRARSKTSAAVELLMKLQPAVATVIRNGEEKVIPAAEIEEGDALIIRPGESISADGVVVSGNSAVDESMLTGESMPVKKEANSKVFGGTINGAGSLTVRAENVGGKTVLSGIIRLVEQAQSSKAKIQKTADKAAAVFVPVVVGISLLTLILTLAVLRQPSEAVSRAVAVLVVACPCSLGLATPTALMVGTGRAASMGILIKSADSLETACKIKSVILDKTGTVTKGKPAVTDLKVLSHSRDEALQLAASAEQYSEHPVAKAVCGAWQGEILSADNFTSITGRGVSADIDGRKVLLGNKPLMDEHNVEFSFDASVWENEGKTVLFMSADGKAAAVIAVADPVSETSAAAVSELHSLGIQVQMVTGDNCLTANAVAKQVGIDRVTAGVLPDGKVEAVKEAKKANKTVAMVGDGINDAPALAAADVGFAMGSGTDIAMESGDVVLVGGNIASLPAAVRLSKATMRKIRQNLFWAFFYNCIGIPIAALGLLSPVVAGAAMAFSSVSVVTNSLLLRKSKI